MPQRVRRGSPPRPASGHRRGSKLPHLRFSRDKRGYEHTFVVHGEKRRGRSRSRILYWFRTPPGVRVGRAALDPEAIKLIEAHNPEVQFDWPRILKGEGAAEPRSRHEPPEPRRSRAERPRSGRAVPPPAPESARAAATGVASPTSSEQDVTAVESAAVAPEPAPPVVDTPAGRRLGAEGLARLRARHAEIIARIDERPGNPGVPGEPDELKSRAERLNPDAWVTDEEVASGLEQYEAVYESLRAVLGRRRSR